MMQQPNSDNTPSLLAIWSKCIDIQMHFNSLNLTIKGLAITGFTFFIAGIGYLYKEKVYLEEINVLMWFSLMGFLIIALFYFIDRHWYHQYLKVTSIHIDMIESTSNLSPDLKDALMISKKISDVSKQPIHGVIIGSVNKTRLFYFLLAAPFIIIAIYAYFKHDPENVKFLEIQNSIDVLQQEIEKLEAKIILTPTSFEVTNGKDSLKSVKTIVDINGVIRNCEF